MDTALLTTFLTLARMGHMTRAAAALHLTQPAVSAQLMRLEEQLGQKVTVSNIPGAGGAASASMLASSIEQGYVFQFGGSSVVSIAPLLSPASYGPDSFTYVAGLSLEQPAFVTGATHGIQDWPGLLAYLRATPGQIYVSQAAEDRLIIRALAKREGLELRTVPTSGGAGMAPLVISGDAVFAYSGGTHTGYTASGEMRVLASLADTRLLGYPDAPTLRELGYDLGLHTMRIVMVASRRPAARPSTWPWSWHCAWQAGSGSGRHSPRPDRALGHYQQRMRSWQRSQNDEGSDRCNGPRLALPIFHAEPCIRMASFMPLSIRRPRWVAC